MNLDWISGLTLFATFISLSFLAIYYYSICREINAAKRETSRFPLFAARDRLIGLVIDERMSEDDTVWKSTYATANMLLDLDQRLHLKDIVKMFVDYRIELDKNPNLKRKVADLKKKTSAARNRVPEFDRIENEMFFAINHLIKKRTPISQRLVLWISNILAIVMFQGIRTAVSITRILKSPSVDDFIGWPSFVAQKK